MINMCYGTTYILYLNEKKEGAFIQPFEKGPCVQLDNLSKIRVKLAVNTLSKEVAEEMREHENNVTESTQGIYLYV
jgi:hypothetical protein